MNLRESKKDLDHRVWKLLKRHELSEKKVLVALSGGVDSVVLLVTLLKTLGAKNLIAFHYHHGAGSNLAYRNQAVVFCQNLCADLGVPLHISKAEGEASSEAELRDLRYAEINRLKKEQNIEVVALGHHRDDLLETRMLRLIRGTGGQGLAAMHEWDGNLFRPFLEISKEELRKYAAEEDLKFVEDPSNEDLDPMRNWLRQEWLPSLENRSPGALGALSRSLETLVSELEAADDLLQHNEDYKLSGLQRSFYLTLGLTEQRRLLAQYLFALGKRNFSQSHLEEVQKRLDKSQKVITFQVGGLNWEINAEQIKVQS